MISLFLVKRFNFAPLKIATTILPFVLTITMLFNSLQLSFTYAYYYLDKTDFIAMLCVNKDKPEMHCDGKCQLMKVAQNNNANTDKVPTKNFNLKEVILFVVEQTTYAFLNNPLEKSEKGYYNNLYAFSAMSVLDHPPQA
ncbi:hypothetical protein [Yeosuana aromativorans]|nr:hypothetical protein [Yeosuana aromativorans]